jgi:hypothetical protein
MVLRRATALKRLSKKEKRFSNLKNLKGHFFKFFKFKSWGDFFVASSCLRYRAKLGWAAQFAWKRARSVIGAFGAAFNLG